MVERAARFRTRYTPRDDAMLRKNTIIESMALPMNAPAWAGLGMMKTKIKMRMSSVHSHLGMHLDCPPHASGARPCTGIVTEVISWRERAGRRRGLPCPQDVARSVAHRTRCRTTQVAVAGRIVRTARRAILKIDPRGRGPTQTPPRARLCVLPVP